MSYTCSAWGSGIAPGCGPLIASPGHGGPRVGGEGEGGGGASQR